MQFPPSTPLVDFEGVQWFSQSQRLHANFHAYLCLATQIRAPIIERSGYHRLATFDLNR